MPSARVSALTREDITAAAKRTVAVRRSGRRSSTGGNYVQGRLSGGSRSAPK